MDRWKFISIVLMALAITQADAKDHPDYFTVGVGNTWIPHSEDNGWWYQQGFEYTEMQRSPSYLIGIGWEINDRFSFELDYRELGKTDMFSGAVQPDENYAYQGSNYPGGHPCNGPCNPTQWYWTHAEISGIGTSFVMKNKLGPLSLRSRLGAFLARHKFDVHYTVLIGDHAPNPYSRTMHYVKEDRTNLGYFYGFGIGYKALAVEYSAYPNTGTPNSPFSDAFGWMLTYRVSL